MEQHVQTKSNRLQDNMQNMSMLLDRNNTKHIQETYPSAHPKHQRICIEEEEINHISGTLWQTHT